MEKEIIKHPAFAQISFSRTYGMARFYGSELKQQNYITMNITESEIERDLTSDRFCSKKPILQIRLSSNQFSELITSLNTGSGVPCTLEYINNNKVESLPEIENRKEFVHRKFKDRMNEFSSSLISTKKRIKELVAKKNLSKEDQLEINRLTEFIIIETSSNIPFFAECFQETCDEIVEETKLEIDNQIQGKINRLGMKALSEKIENSNLKLEDL